MSFLYLADLLRSWAATVKTSLRPLLSMLSGVLLFTGCATSSSTPARPVYTAGQAGQIIRHESGLVMAVEEVLIQAPGSAAGSPGTGSQIGSAVGRGAMTGNPMVLAGAIGGIIGGRAGAGLDNQIGDKITIHMDDGKIVTIVQARDKLQPLMPGERVVVETGSAASPYGGGNTRVLREAVADDNLAIGVTVVR